MRGDQDVYSISCQYATGNSVLLTDKSPVVMNLAEIHLYGEIANGGKNDGE